MLGEGNGGEGRGRVSSGVGKGWVGELMRRG